MAALPETAPAMVAHAPIIIRNKIILYDKNFGKIIEIICNNSDIQNIAIGK